MLTGNTLQAKMGTWPKREICYAKSPSMFSEEHPSGPWKTKKKKRAGWAALVKGHVYAPLLLPSLQPLVHPNLFPTHGREQLPHQHAPLRPHSLLQCPKGLDLLGRTRNELRNQLVQGVHLKKVLRGILTKMHTSKQTTEVCDTWHEQRSRKGNVHQIGPGI